MLTFPWTLHIFHISAAAWYTLAARSVFCFDFLTLRFKLFGNRSAEFRATSISPDFLAICECRMIFAAVANVADADRRMVAQKMTCDHLRVRDTVDANCLFATELVTHIK